MFHEHGNIVNRGVGNEKKPGIFRSGFKMAVQIIVLPNYFRDRPASNPAIFASNLGLEPGTFRVEYGCSTIMS